MEKKPPDKYKCIKMRLHSIIRDPQTKLTIINDFVERTNRFVIKAYQLLRLWLLTRYNQNNLIIVDTNVIKTIFKVLNKRSKKSKKSKNDLLCEELQNFFKIKKEDKEDGDRLTKILEYCETEIVTAFENNIKFHFMDYLNRYINSYWLIQHKDALENGTMRKKDIYKELKLVKKDLLNGTNLCDAKYHGWLNEIRLKVLPPIDSVDEHYYYDLKKSPQNYVKHMIWMNIELEKIGGKMFQFCPQRTTTIPCHVHIDNTSIMYMLINKNERKRYQGHFLNLAIRDEMWELCFQMPVIKKIKIKGYVFDYAFQTNGFDVSLRFVHLDQLEKKQDQKAKMAQGLKDTVGFTDEQRDQRHIDKDKLKTQTQKPQKKKQKTEKKEKHSEFLYIDEVPLDLFKGKKYVVVDPGKHDLLSMMDSEGEQLKYSKRQRDHETKRLKYKTLNENYREKLGILKIEEKLDGLNVKTCNVDLYTNYLKVKTEANSELFNLYRQEKFRKLKFFAFIQRQRADARMLNLIEKTYGKNKCTGKGIYIIHGNWSQGKQMKHLAPTPNLGIKRKLAERFSLYNIDEYKTSQLSHVTGAKCKNLKLKNEDGTYRKIHSVLTYQMENKRLGCMNRDTNACHNLRKIYEHYLATGERLEAFRRTSASLLPALPTDLQAIEPIQAKYNIQTSCPGKSTCMPPLQKGCKSSVKFKTI